MSLISSKTNSQVNIKRFQTAKKLDDKKSYFSLNGGNKTNCFIEDDYHKNYLLGKLKEKVKIIKICILSLLS